MRFLIALHSSTFLTLLKNQQGLMENSSTLIDPILVSDACRVLDAGTISVDNSISDHKATFVSVKTETPLLKSYTREVWNYKNANFEELNEKIRQHDWDHLIRNTISVDEA